MNDLESAKDALDLLDRVRCGYRSMCPDNVSGLLGFICGYSLAKGFPGDEFGEHMRRFVETFSQSKLDKPWHEFVSDSAVVPRCEIPLVYAITDFCRNKVYYSAISSAPTASERDFFYADQLRYSGPYGLPAPHKLILTAGLFDCWHLFFLNESGNRYHEASMSSKESLMRWVRRTFGIEFLRWQDEEPGVFALQKSDVERSVFPK